LGNRPPQCSGAAGVVKTASCADTPLPSNGAAVAHAIDSSPSQPPPPPPQQFLLLPPSPPQQPRTCPDGSSNPDIDLVPLPKRSPGSGKSSQSDPEEEMTARRETAVIAVATASNNNSETATTAVAKKKEVSSFAALLARLFGSNAGGGSSSHSKKGGRKAAAGGSGGGNKRSKSCDKELETSAAMEPKAAVAQRKGVKSASGSPLKQPRHLPATAKDGKKGEQQSKALQQPRATTPSTLSLDTEWEFQAQERSQQRYQQHDNEDADDYDDDMDNGNDIWQQQQQQLTPFNNSMQYTSPLGAAAGANRKSSGYDSLESCSLDSMENGNCFNNSYYDNRLLLGGQQQQQVYGTYAVPELWINKSGELDEVALLKLEIGRHPDLLNKNY
jgi:hypothetical protein